MSTRGTWAREFLAEIEAPTSPENVTAVLTWIASERGVTEQPIAATFNPLDTTLDWPGATAYNSAGVKNYPTWDDGLGATVATISVQAYGYPAIIAALRSGQTTAEHTAAVINASSWGSHPSSELTAYVRANFDAQDALEVGDGPPDPIPPAPPAPTQGSELMVVLLCDGAAPLLVTADGQRGWEVAGAGTVPTATVTADQRAYIVQQLHT